MTETTQNEKNLQAAREEYAVAKDKLHAMYLLVQEDVTKIWESRKGWVPKSLEDVNLATHDAYANKAAHLVLESWVKNIDSHLEFSGMYTDEESGVWLPCVQVTLAQNEKVPGLSEKMLEIVTLFGQDSYSFGVFESTLSEIGVIRIEVQRDGTARRTMQAYSRITTEDWMTLDEVLTIIASQNYYPA